MGWEGGKVRHHIWLAVTDKAGVVCPGGARLQHRNIPARPPYPLLSVLPNNGVRFAGVVTVRRQRLGEGWGVR